MNTTRQSKTWPYDLVKGIVLLILLGLMLYSRPDMSAQIQRQLGLPFGTVTVLDAPQVTGSSAITLSGHTQSGAFVEVFAGEASLGTAAAGPDGSWSLPVTLPSGTYQLRAQARDAAGAALGSAAVQEWSSEQQAAGAAAGSQAAGGTDAEADTEASADAAGTTADSGAVAGTNAAPATASGDDTAASSAPDAAGGPAQAPAMAPPEVGADGVTFTGKGEPGTTIVVASAAGIVGTADVSPDGNWTLNVRLAPGKYELQARATDASGVAAGSSPVVAVTVPAAGSPDEATGAETTAPSTATGANTGSQSAGAPSSASAQGSLSAAQAADGAANLSGLGTPGTTVEIVAAQAAAAGGMTGAVTGSAGNKTAEIEGTGRGANAATGSENDAIGNEVAAKVVLGSVVVAADGTWQLSAKIDPGEYLLAVRTLDGDGAIVDESDTVPLSVPMTSAGEAPAGGDAATGEAGHSTAPDAAASAAVTGTVPVTGSASTSATTSAALATTSAVPSNAVPQVSAPVVAGNKVTLTGTASPGGTVELVTNEEVLGEATADADGLWIVTVQLEPGSYALRIRAVSSADKSIQYSRVVSLTLPAASGTTVAAGETITPATPGTEATAAVTPTTHAAATSPTGTVTATTPMTATTSVTTTTPITTSPITATTATTASAVAAVAAKTPAATPAVAAPSGTATSTAAAASSAALTTTPAAGAAAAVAPTATATPSDTPPTLSQPEISGSTLTLSGTGTPGTSVEIVSGTTVLGKATVGTDGTWSLAAEVKPGSYKLQVVRKDAAGKVISQSPVVSLDIPSTESAPVLDTPQVAADNSITLTGTSDPGSEVEIIQDGAVIGTANVQNDGQWTYTYPASTTGNVQVAAQISGQPATRTRPVIVVVPVVAAPAAPALTATDAASTPPEQTVDEPGRTGSQAYVVQPGDTLMGLAQEYLGSETRYQEIVAATNVMAKQDPAFKQITDPNLIVVGQQVWIPAP